MNTTVPVCGRPAGSITTHGVPPSAAARHARHPRGARMRGARAPLFSVRFVCDSTIRPAELIVRWCAEAPALAAAASPASSARRTSVGGPRVPWAERRLVREYRVNHGVIVAPAQGDSVFAIAFLRHLENGSHSEGEQ